MTGGLASTQNGNNILNDMFNAGVKIGRVGEASSSNNTFVAAEGVPGVVTPMKVRSTAEQPFGSPTVIYAKNAEEGEGI